VLSKCANPECSEQFRYLHQGKLFLIIPTPNVRADASGSLSFLYERFWLCDSCSKNLTLVWGGTKVKIVPLAEKPMKVEAADPEKVVPISHLHRRAARAGVQGG
jgi:hypothetical protein